MILRQAQDEGQRHDAPAFMLLGDPARLDSGALARRLLTLPDVVLLGNHQEIEDACRNEREAFDYVATRMAALCSRRDESGAVMPGISIALIHARMALRRVAGT